MNLNRPVAILKKDNIAMDVISTALKGGYLSLFIGAGVSKSATSQFPDWHNLVSRCCNELGVEFNSENSSNKYLRQIMELVEDKCLENGINYAECVKKSLYSGVCYNLDMMKIDLLISLGSLVMGSVRGSANSVINYNFDDLLEWYLEFHGFKTQVISKHPTIIMNSDVSIYHPHGFLPFDCKFKEFQSSNVILSQKSYLQNYKENNSWNEFQIGQLTSKIGLFVGLSGDDEHIEYLCERAFDRVKRTDKRTFIGYIVLVDNDENRSFERLLKNRGLIALYIGDHKELPRKLLDISRIAGKITITN